MHDEKVRAQSVEQLLKLIPRIEGDQKLARDIVINARGHRQEAREVTGTIAAILDLLKADAICVVSAHNSFTPEGRAVSWPGNFPKQLETSCAELGLPLLHAARLVAEHGTAFSLKPDRHHFTSEFLSILGEEMLAVGPTLARPRSRRRLSVPTTVQNMEELRVVEPSGIEPLTSCMPCRRSPS
jgi:hypothetical protein